VHLEFSDTLPTGDGRFGVDLRVALRDGRVLAQKADFPRGHPSRPLSREALAAKFVECARTVLDATAACNAVAQVEALDRLPTLAPLLELLRPA
jgi:2-methylcitrate dehydratase PrpD